VRNCIPANWKPADLVSVAVVTSGQSPPGSTYNTIGEGLPFFQGKAEFGDVSPTPVKWCSAPLRIAHPGDVLISVRAPVGPTNLANIECCIGRGLAAITPLGGMPSKFYLYYLRHSVENLVRQATGTTFQAISGKQLRAHEVLVPPLPEQHRIVEAIESYLTRLDAAVASLERVQKNLERYRASVLKAAVEGRLVPTEAELAKKEGRSYEPARELLKRILNERRKKWIEDAAEKARAKAEEKARKVGKYWTPEYNAKILEKARKYAEAKYKEPVPSDTTDLPKLPEGWCWATIAQLASAKPHSLTDGPFGSNLKTEHYTEAGPRVIRLQNIGDGQFINAEAHISGEHYEQLKKHATYPGDVVIASLGVELPKACLVPERLGQAIVKADCLRLKPNARLVDRHYLMHALNSRPIRKRTEALVHGMGRPRIGLTLLRTIPVPLPPHAEQKRIANRIDTLLSITENMVQLLERQNLRTARLRQSILKWAFEGKLVPQDPEDEPASALLDRIKAECSASRRYR